ncbi:MAG: hypothetical protein LLF96_10235, partial [Eubacteriales bacterium]|nr:hypothetical protein [Eubacteriales bacterium]
MQTDPDETGNTIQNGGTPEKPKKETFFQTLFRAVRLSISPANEKMPDGAVAAPAEQPMREIKFHQPDEPSAMPVPGQPEAVDVNRHDDAPADENAAPKGEGGSTAPHWPQETASFTWESVAFPVSFVTETEPTGLASSSTAAEMADEAEPALTNSVVVQLEPEQAGLTQPSAANEATDEAKPASIDSVDTQQEPAQAELTPSSVIEATDEAEPALTDGTDTQQEPVQAELAPPPATEVTNEAKSASTDGADAQPEAPRVDSTSTPPALPVEDIGISASISSDPADLVAGEDIAAIVENVPELTDNGEEAPEEEDIDFNELRATLIALQQQIRAANIPVVIVFEGWDAAGKGTMLSKLLEGLDPRGYQVYPMRQPTEDESRFPLMRRYWVKTPAQGDISIFCASWYREVSKACFENKTARKRLAQSYREIVNLESSLVCDGVLLIKFFLHISRKEQKERLKVLESKKNTRWRVQKEDWEQNDRYGEYLRLYDAMIARTHYEGMLWHVLRSDNRRVCIKQIYDVVINAFRAALKDRDENRRIWDTPFLPHLDSVTTRTFPQLVTFDPEQALTDPYKPAVDKAQKRLRKLQNDLYRKGVSMAICFEGWDASGKGGVIRRLSSALDPRGYDVVPIAAPTPLEKSHHHLWRFWDAVPEDGHIAIFDRTWYGRVLVERVEGFCTQSEWKRAYEEINRFEAELVAHGMIVCKFWLQIDSDTQLSRFQDREYTLDK